MMGLEESFSTHAPSHNSTVGQTREQLAPSRWRCARPQVGGSLALPDDPAVAVMNDDGSRRAAQNRKGRVALIMRARVRHRVVRGARCEAHDDASSVYVIVRERLARSESGEVQRSDEGAAAHKRGDHRMRESVTREPLTDLR